MNVFTNPFLNLLSPVYGAPSRDETEARNFLATYKRLTDVYSLEEQLEGADRMLRLRKFKSWPSVKDCLDVLEGVREGRKARAATEHREAVAKQKQEAKQLSPAEQKALEQFVDDCADSKIDMGFCHASLQKLAKNMRARRLRKQWEGKPL